MNIIQVNNLTKDYGQNQGIFDICLEVGKGETLGFLGPNGAGKSTTMRHLMGYTAPQAGQALILNMDSRKDHYKILSNVGYLPGEVTLPENLSGLQFIKMMQDLKKSKNMPRVNYLLETFKLDPKPSIKKMSIGERRKLAIVVAFMDDPAILLLDEPTSGLDPDMQEVFINFIKEEKKAGKSILLSSHIFSEVEALCDRIAIVKDGRVVSVVDAQTVKHTQRKTFKIKFNNSNDGINFKNEKLEITEITNDSYQVIIEDENINDFLKIIKKYDVLSFEQVIITLEDYFMHFYKNDKTFGGVKNGRSN